MPVGAMIFLGVVLALFAILDIYMMLGSKLYISCALFL